tara:strand:+ start:2575 stop:3162 length:588 start_codon:yes stop_codon:yes gene_type:complete
MAISYPLATPTSIGIESIELRAVNAVATSQSPFTYKQQVISHGGQKWEASVTIPPVHRDLAAPWKSMLVALKGPTGTFLLGDPDYATPQGTVSSCTLSGSAGDETPTVVMTGTLKAGDYIQLGSAGNSRLHQVLEDQSGSGTLEIWPALRSSYTNTTVVFNNPKGVFRLASNVTSWSINNASTYGISFEAVEALT